MYVSLVLKQRDYYDSIHNISLNKMNAPIDDSFEYNTEYGVEVTFDSQGQMNK